MSVVRLRDVAKVERDSQQYDQSCTLNGSRPWLCRFTNCPAQTRCKTAQGVYAQDGGAEEAFPRGPGLQNRLRHDAVHRGIDHRGASRRCCDAIILVAIVVLVFLQNWRATLIPLVAVPVAIVGTFAVMAVLGFSLNNLSLFGLVLAIGIVVDDAIVVVENVERWLEQACSRARRPARRWTK